MLVDNMGTIIGCCLGGIGAFFLMGVLALIPFVLAIVLYTWASRDKSRMRAKF